MRASLDEKCRFLKAERLSQIRRGGNVSKLRHMLFGFDVCDADRCVKTSCSVPLYSYTVGIETD